MGRTHRLGSRAGEELAAYGLRLLCLVGLPVRRACLAGLQSRVVPYVVEVDKLGETRAVAPALQDYKPADAQIAWYLAQFIVQVRSVSTDPVLVRKNWLGAYDFATERAALFLNTYARKADPFGQIGTRNVSGQVTSVIRASDTSFQVKWIEQVFERGALVRTERWSAILGVALQPPRTAEQLRKNPLGLYVHAIEWARELDATPSNQPKESVPSRSFSFFPSLRSRLPPARTNRPSSLTTLNPPSWRRAAQTRADRRGAEGLAPAGQLQPEPSKKRPDTRPPMTRVEAANKAATREPTQYGYLNAIQVYPFADGALYQLYTAPEHVSDIALQPGEKLTSVSSGDTVRWVIGDTTSGSTEGQQVHVLVKPFAPDLKTNLVITTDRRSYHLQLESTVKTFMAALSWTYPQEQLMALRRQNAEAAATEPVAANLSLENIRFRYEVTGDDPPWKPVRAFDDGKKVYIEFPRRIDQGEAPPLFIVGPNGDNELVNYRMRGTYYVVDRLFGAAELRFGTDPQQIVRISRTDAPDRKEQPAPRKNWGRS